MYALCVYHTTALMPLLLITLQIHLRAVNLIMLIFDMLNPRPGGGLSHLRHGGGGGGKMTPL